MSVTVVDFHAAARERWVARLDAMRRHPAGSALDHAGQVLTSTVAARSVRNAERGVAGGTGKSDATPLDAPTTGGAA